MVAKPAATNIFGASLQDSKDMLRSLTNPQAESLG